MWNPDLYKKTMKFAGRAHGEQTYPGTDDTSYLAHIADVCQETLQAILKSPESGFDIDFAMQCAILHDTVEDTDISLEDIEDFFGKKVAEGVWALTKNEEFPTKQERMKDSLDRILLQPSEVRVVKMADRVSNLQRPPYYWNVDKKKAYHEEAKIILERLGGVCPAIETRLQEKIDNYQKYFDQR